MKIKEEYTDSFEIEELACKILGIDYEAIDGDTQVIEEELYEKLDIDLSIFQGIINRLLPLIHVEKSQLTGQIYRGFADVDKSCWIVKREINIKEK